MIYDVIIIGGGAAGLTAAIYTARSGLNTLLLEGDLYGGQLMKTERLENYPGFPDGVDSTELSTNILKQARNFGADIKLGSIVSKAELEIEIKRVFVGSNLYEGKTLIVATGANPKPLNVPGEEELVGIGVHYCAICDGPEFKDENVIVVGGGNSAVEESFYLLNFVKEICLIHEFDNLQASVSNQQKILNDKRVKFIWSSQVMEVVGGEFCQGVKIRGSDNDEELFIAGKGIFVFIGYIPNTGLFQGKLKLDDQNYIITDSEMRTSIDGVFACGDVRSKSVRQAIIAAGEGAYAAVQAERFLSSR